MIVVAIAALILARTAPLPQSDASAAAASPTHSVEATRAARDRPDADPASLVQMQAFGRCAAQRFPDKAAALLQMNFTTPQYQQALRRLAMASRSCLSGKQGRFAPVLFAGALAEELLSHTDRVADVLAYTPGDPTIEAISETDLIAACVARTAPGEVANLFATPAASDAEKAAMRELTPVVETCVAKGQMARFNHPGLRAILATASYRIVEAARAAAEKS